MEKDKVAKEEPVYAVASYVKDLFSAQAPGGIAGKGIEIGLGAALSKTVLRRLPMPFNFIAPLVVEKIIMKHGVEEGREILIKGLKWVKKATDEKPLMVM